MSRKRTAEEYNQIAQEDDWVLGAHEEEDNKTADEKRGQRETKRTSRRPWISG
jgi:hypothetical protein